MSRIFSYYDQDSNEYVELEVDLKDDVKEEEVVSFCASMSDYDLLKGKVDPRELKLCFFNLLESSVLSFEEINSLLDKDDENNNLYVIESSRKFLNNFKCNRVNRYTPREYKECFRQSYLYNRSGINDSFIEKAKSIKFNTKIVNYLGDVPMQTEIEKQRVYK